MDHDNNFQSADEVTKHSGLSRRDTVSTENLQPSGGSKTNTNLPNTSKFTEYVSNNEFINKEDVSHNTKKYFFDLSEDSVTCNRTVIPNQNIIKPDINNAIPLIPTKSKTATIKFPSKTASQDYSLDPDDSFLTLEKQINELPFTATDWQSNINRIILGNNKEQTPCENMEFNALKTKESSEISKQTIKKSHSNIDTISMKSKVTTSGVESLTSIASKEPDNLKSYGICNQNIAKYHSDFGKISIESEQITPNIKTGLSLVSVALSQDVKDIIHKYDSSPATDNEIEQLFGSLSSSEFSDAYDNTLEYIEYKLNYKPKNKGIDKLQIQNEKLYQESLANREPISETEFKLTESHFNKQYYNPSLDTLSEVSNSKISNIHTVKSSESEDVSLDRDPVYTDNDSPMTESQVKEKCDRPENLISNEIFNQNIATYNSDFGKTSTDCKQITLNVKTDLSIASDAVSQDVKDIIHKNDSLIVTDNEIEQLFGSPSSSESSDACDNTLEYIEHLLNYKPKNKGIDKLQILNEKLYQESLANREPIGETEFKLTEGHSNIQCYSPSLDTLSEESNLKISNINTVTSSQSDDVSPYRDPVCTDNNFPMTESQVKELCDSPGNLISNEMFNQNIAICTSDFGKTSMECKQITPNIKTGLSVASDTVSPMNYKPKNKGHKKQIQDKNISLNLLERKDTVSETHLNKQYDANFHIPLIKLNTSNFSSPSCLSTETMSTDCEAVLKDNMFLPLENQLEKVSVSQENPKLNKKLNHNNKTYSRNFGKTLVKSQPSTPNIKISSPYAVKKSSAMSVKETPNKSNKYHYIQSPVAAYIHHSPRVPLVKDVYPKKPLPSGSRKLQQAAGSEAIKQQATGSEAIKSSNKENINLPLVAYKSAKETKVIEIPDKNKLPKCLWAKQMTSSPQAVVIKHEYREFNSQGAPPMSEDSFGSLPLFQADLSVCTQKMAFDDEKN